MQCNWCVSLDIAHILALQMSMCDRITFISDEFHKFHSISFRFRERAHISAVFCSFPFQHVVCIKKNIVVSMCCVENKLFWIELNWISQVFCHFCNLIDEL